MVSLRMDDSIFLFAFGFEISALLSATATLERGLLFNSMADTTNGATFTAPISLL